MDAAATDAPAAAAAVPAAIGKAAASADRLVRRWVILMTALLLVTWRLAARSGIRPDLLAR
jgi:hypothetical protein